jgi:hypothetical protein
MNEILPLADAYTLAPGANFQDVWIRMRRGANSSGYDLVLVAVAQKYKDLGYPYIYCKMTEGLCIIEPRGDLPTHAGPQSYYNNRRTRFSIEWPDALVHFSVTDAESRKCVDRLPPFELSDVMQLDPCQLGQTVFAPVTFLRLRQM